MNLKHLIQNLGRGCSLMALCGAAMASDALLTNTTSFRIPFAVENVESSAVTGSAILFVSRNGDPVMERNQTVDAESGGFQFNAPADGRYGFAVRLVDATGKPIGNDGRLEPEMEVVVDTVPPELSFQLIDIGNGEISLTWIANEAAVAPGSLKIEYAEGTDGRWKDVSVSPGASGHAMLKSQPGTSVSVRGFITDLAGNQGTGSGQLVLNAKTADMTYPASTANENYNRTSPFGVQETAPKASVPRTTQGTTQAVGPSPFSAESNDAPYPYSANSYAASSVAEQGATRTALAQPKPALSPSPVTMPVQVQQAPQQQQLAKPAAAVFQAPPATHAPTVTPAPTTNSGYFPTPTIRGNHPSLGGGHGAYVSNQFPAAQSSSFSSSTFPAPITAGSSLTSTMSTASGLTGSQQIVNNRVFEIDYRVEDVGPSGVGSVELFVTENGGREWFRYGDDPDRTSPFQVDTRGEGTFGFAVRVKSGLGFSDPPPQPGDQPDIVIVVDQTPPIAELSVPQIVVDGGGRIRMTWRLSDSNLSPAPIRLEYASRPSGPWTPAFDWQVDQGGYEMPIQPGLPNRLHFRLLTRDVAGNVASVQTNQPLLIDQQRPTARLLRVQPVSRSMR